MIVVDGRDVALESPDDCTAFHVQVVGDDGGGVGVGEALDASGAGRLAEDGEHGLIEIGWIRQAATGRVDPDWDQRFEAMVDYARGQGWVDEGESSIVGHIERTEV